MNPLGMEYILKSGSRNPNDSVPIMIVDFYFVASMIISPRKGRHSSLLSAGFVLSCQFTIIIF